MKRLAALMILAMWLATSVAGQGIAGADWIGPDKVLAGERIVLRLAFRQEDAETVSGNIQFNNKQLDFVNVETAPGWDISLSQRNFTLTKTDASSKELWIALTFRVKNLPEGTSVAVTANDLILSRQEERISLGDAQWEMTVWTGLSGENHLTRLWVENGNMWPEFQSDLHHYLVTVPANTKKPVVHAEAAPKAQLRIDAPYFTREGLSEVTVTVTAEDGTQRVYTMQVLQETGNSDAKPLLTEPSASQPPSGAQQTPGWVLVSGIFGGAALLGAAGILVERIVKKNR